MTNADREELGRVGCDNLHFVDPRPDSARVGWDEMSPDMRERYCVMAEAVARKVLGRAVERLQTLARDAGQQHVADALYLAADELQGRLDAPAEGRA